MDLAQKPVYKLDLAAGTSVVNLTTPLVEGDDRAQTFTLELTDKCTPANLDGYSVTAYFGRGKTAEAEADTIPLSGTVSGNVATITLTESCYSRSCYFSMPIRLSNGATGQKRTYLIVRGTVVKSVDGTIIDPDGSVPSLDDIFAQIAVMERSRQAAEEATDEALAAAARADKAREGIQGDLATLTEEMENVYTIDKSRNLVNTDVYEVGAIQENGTIATNDAWANYRTSDFIKLEQNQDYTYSVFRQNKTIMPTEERKVVLLYNDDKEPVSESYINNATGYSNTFNSGNNKYARVSYASVLLPMMEVGTERTDYVPFSETYQVIAGLGDKPQEQVAKIVDERLNAGTDRLAGKKWWACGDSFTEWTTETYSAADYPNINGLAKYKTYPFWIGTRTGMEVYNFAVSGQTMATPEDGAFTNAFSSKYSQIPDDVDYITLQFGINDSHHATGSSGTDGEDVTGGIPIGDVDDTTIHTFCGAYNVVLENLIRNHPFAKIGIIVSNGCDTDEYRIKTIQIAQKWGIPYIDLNGDERTPAMIRSSNPNVSSVLKQIRVETMSAEYPTNQHPNAAAHEYQSTFIEQFLRSL